MKNPLTKTLAFPFALVLLQLGAAGTYFLAGDWRRGLYWLFATGITIAVSI